MNLISTLALFALAFACVDATKPGMHGGRLTLQDLLALRDGVLLPEMAPDGEDWNIAGTVSASTPRPTETIPEGFQEDAEDAKRSECDVTRCERSGGECIIGTLSCFGNLQLHLPECDGCYCGRGST